MATHPGMLIAYDVMGDIIATQDYQTIMDDDGFTPLGLADYATHEDAGGEMTDFWTVVQTEGAGSAKVTIPAKGSKVWPEWLGGRTHDFRVELEGPAGRKHIAALVHKESGYRRERTIVEANISLRVAVYDPEPADIRDLVGGPDRPMRLDDIGRVVVRAPIVRPSLPLIGVTKP